MKLLGRLSCLFAFLISTPTFAFENLVYTQRDFPVITAKGQAAIADLKSHADKINILVSQAYHIDRSGRVQGEFNPIKFQIAKENNIKFLALVSNSVFEAEPTHQFLSDKLAQAGAVQAILKLCQLNNFAGVQVDFEGMRIEDRKAFSEFYQNLANELHKNHFIVSVAIVPRTSDNPESDYLRARYKRWSGVYDYKLLGENSDFVTLMAYDQHSDFTTPGPIAGITWDEALIKYAIKYIPAAKISLGVPWYSGIWYTGLTGGGSLRDIGNNISYSDVLTFLHKNNVKLQWDATDKVPYVFYSNNFLYQYIFAENAASFKAKLYLALKYRLRGISNWSLGQEDPEVWQQFLSGSKRKSSFFFNY